MAVWLAADVSFKIIAAFLKKRYGVINLITTKLFPNHSVSSIKSIKQSYDLRWSVVLLGILFSVAHTDQA